MDVDYDFEPICPLLGKDRKCTYKCGWSIRVDGGNHACALAVLAAKGAPNLSVNAKDPQKEQA